MLADLLRYKMLRYISTGIVFAYLRKYKPIKISGLYTTYAVLIKFHYNKLVH